MELRAFRDHFREGRLFKARIIQSVLLILILVTGLVARLIYLQIDQHQYFSDMSQENRVKVQPLPPTRGLIYDRKGRILAQNLPVHSLVIIPEKVNDLEQTLEQLASLLEIKENDLKRFHRLRKQRRRFENIPIRSSLSETELAIFSVNRHRFPGVEIEAKLLRSYPYGKATSHVIGYVGRVSLKDLKTIDQSAYSGTSHIGKTGVEKFYETELHGKVGLQRVEVNAFGRTIKIIEEQSPVSGVDLHLSLDLDLQLEAIDAFGDHTGSIVAIDPATGAILAMVSKPGFDANLFVEGISSKNYNRLRNSPLKPLFNRSLRGQYPPGSTTKPFFGLIGLETGTVNYRDKIYCPGFYRLPNKEHKYRDWKKGGHGLMNLTNSLVQSCDVYFYDLAHRLGIQQMHDSLKEFGFGSIAGIDIYGEKSGLLPSPAWKHRKQGVAWYPGETLIMGIGQGFFLITPVELASATATMASKGKHFRPHIVAATVSPGQKEPTTKKPHLISQVPVVNAENWQKIHHAMTEVIENPRGTARRIRTKQYRIAGKTGTAQVFTVAQDEKYDETKISKKNRDHALFIAFAPIENPRIALAVIVENGGHGGSVAAPIARRIMDRYLVEQ